VLRGLVVVAAPFLLGALTDRLGFVAGATIEPVLIGLGVQLMTTGLRASRRSRSPSAPQ
jgi:hypothetical protein